MNQSPIAPPEMSVVLIAPDSFDTIWRTVRALSAQSVRDQLELVIVTSSAERVRSDALELTGFADVRVVELGAFTSMAQVLAAGVRAARAPIVAFTEDHCFPARFWAAHLIQAHRKPWAVVGPVVRNGNPDSLISWANLAIEYGAWLDPAPSGPRQDLMWHNATYKRELLLKYGAALEMLLEAETVLHYDMVRRGYSLCLEPKAVVYHLNFSRLAPAMVLRFNAGRVFAATRVRRFSPLRRLCYILGSPLIPFVRLVRIVRALRAPGRPRALIPRLLPILWLLLTIDGLGELFGYCVGAGNSRRVLLDMDFQRERFMNQHDRQLFATNSLVGSN